MAGFKAIFVGDGTLLVRCAQIFTRAGHEIVGISTKDAFIENWAENEGYALLGPQRDLDKTDTAFDILFSVANLEMLPDSVLSRAGRMAVNFHDALLPAYAGLNATSWALLHDEKRHGVTWHQMVVKADAGDILQQQEIEIAPDDTAFSLNTKCYEAGIESFTRLVDGLTAQTLSPREQVGTRSYFGKTRRPDALATLDFRDSVAAVGRLVRALDYGTYYHPLGKPKLWTGETLALAGSIDLADRGAADAPGTILAVDADSVTIAAGNGSVVFKGLSHLCGAPVALEKTFKTGSLLPPLDDATRAAIAAWSKAAAKAQDFWTGQFMSAVPVELPYPHRAATTPPAALMLPSHSVGGSGGDPCAIVSAFAAWLSALTGAQRVSFAVDGTLLGAGDVPSPWYRADLPVNADIDQRGTVQGILDAVASESKKLSAAGPCFGDLVACLADEASRMHAARVMKIGVCLHTGTADVMLKGRDLVLAYDADANSVCLIANAAAFDTKVADIMAGHFYAYFDSFHADRASQLSRVPLLSEDEQERVEASNRTQSVFAADSSIHEEIATQAAQTPDHSALECGEHSLTYAQLDERASALAQTLAGKGAKPGVIVGLCLDRGVDLVIAMVAILKSGAAYLPLDPAYPQQRLRYIAEDAGVSLFVATAETANTFDLEADKVVTPGNAGPAAGQERLDASVAGDDLAYLIYTSGSTGNPKGVMVTHRNVLNFFAGMDARIPAAKNGKPGRWFAVTSPSFDISVLELLWTLARGYTVILQDGRASRAAKAPGFSLFYFSSSAANGGRAAYKLLLDGAKFADANGFEAVWTPERHFHAFGGLFPNPSVAGAAIAAITENVDIRAGSCVLPLHHPIRVAEDWAVVDNLSDGRAGIAIASGWQPNDFVLRPEAFEDRKTVMMDGIETIRRLWKGEAVAFPNHKNEMVETTTLPRPVKGTIPIWLTAASNPETFEMAGKAGCNVLTHLLGQTLEDVADKIRLYRAAWSAAGHPGRGRVTLMLHTFVSDDEDHVRETVREPMKSYLKSAVDLVKKAAWTFPTFVRQGKDVGKSPAEIFEEQDLSPAETDALLDHAFERYYTTSGLFGTPDSAMEMVRHVAQIDTDEIACLIDFGIDADLVLESLPHLKQLLDNSQAAQYASHGGASLAESILAAQTTHFQCTPSMASMLVADAAGRTALSGLEVMMVGGEALPPPLAKDLRSLIPGALLNMYGPTETTIWSSTAAIETVGERIPLGAPIANTALHVVNAMGAECPSYVAGELVIGGAGVTKGYWKREELTAERFVSDPFSQEPGARLYKTGDLVRRHPDGTLEFLGRIDNQIKIRGHRIELGEIETVIADRDDVKQAVVTAYGEGQGDKRLVAYVVANPGVRPAAADIQSHVAASLPDIMVPAQVLLLDRLPLTPNGKVDRKLLPPPSLGQIGATGEPGEGEAPEGDTEQAICKIWMDALGLPSVGVNDNFFDLGGHSLLVVQVQRQIKEALGREIPIADMFRFTTIRSLADYLGKDPGEENSKAVDKGMSRAMARRKRLKRG